MIFELRNKKSLTFYQPFMIEKENKIDMYFSGGIGATAISNNSFSVSNQTTMISEAFQQLKHDIISRGVTYAGNTVASRAGFMAEEFVADSYNLDAIIKKSPSRALTDKSNKLGSADISYDQGKQASLKFYVDAKSSAKAQLNPEYGKQTRIIPMDQKDEAKKALEDLAEINEKKGRVSAAKSQREIKELMDDKIHGKDGTQSTALSKEQNMKMSSAISKNKATNETDIDEKKIDDILKETGVTKKTKKAIIGNELRGVGIAALIGVGIGFTIGFAVSLAQSGVTPDTIKFAIAEGGKSGLSTGIQSIVGYGIGKTLGQLATRALEGILSNLGVAISDNIIKMCTMGTVGAITIAVFSTFQFIKLIHGGMSCKEAAIKVGKQALFSLSLLAVSIAAQGIWGGPAGIIVSTSIGIILITYTIMDTVHQRKFSDEIRKYMIGKCKPSFV